MESPATVDHYKAGMVLSGVGDALGFKWEFVFSGPRINEDVRRLGGVKNITVSLPVWPVSDDTVLHLATGEALATGKEGEELLHEVAFHYKKGMKDMSGRSPGGATINGVHQLKPGAKGGYRIAYARGSGGCGAAMRAMCIGLRYPLPEQLSSLVAVAVETGRMTHTHPTGFLGAVASALFAAYAIQRRPITTWGLGLVKEACPLAKEFVKSVGYAVSETERDWGYFTEKWEKYLELRGLSSGTGPAVFPEVYTPAVRDEVYKSFSWSGWGGSSGHDAPMIALDSLLGAGSDWEELMSRGGFHGGDSDSTAVIACCCWGLVYGMNGVPECNYTKLEYRDRLEKCAEKLYTLSH
ncbi:protein ADP-ribosylarginine hydrolase-like [Clarias magur]|uniref:Protein ADP-ribosylarginine hydrolase-like n=2 Tax=Clarias magur TaxID=1594786 RepID=A0A8J4X3Z9_CLAMG|nr:protein ADP-ribosylarginine hydrolase-like [Clarias magur]